ncbi:anaerobic glycerol-3-phosphate dehydrogenase subunit A, partial [Photobacterium damselae]
HFLEERWKGIKPVFWGDALREGEFTYWIYEGLFGVSDIPQTDEQNPQQQQYTDEAAL